MIAANGCRSARAQWRVAPGSPKRAVAQVQSFKRCVGGSNVSSSAATLKPMSPIVDGNRAERVFVVHGRNGAARDSMFEFLRAIGLRPIEWSQAIQATGKGSPYIGEVLDVAFGQAQAVVVLMTPDDVAYLRQEYSHGVHDRDTDPVAQARPNVLFEAGMAMGRDSDRTVLVELGELRPFSDVAGRHAVRLDNSPARRKDLAQRLGTAGCPVVLTGEDWFTAGDFTPPSPPGGGLPLGKRVPSSGPPSRVRLDLRYHDRSKGGRLEIINMGTEPVFDVNLEFPPEASSFHVLTEDLPIPKLPPGKSVNLITFSSLGGGGKNHFEVRVTGRTAGGDSVVDDIFLSLVD